MTVIGIEAAVDASFKLTKKNVNVRRINQNFQMAEFKHNLFK